jgi:hypothetical protein
MTDVPPKEIEEAAAKVRAYLDSQKAATATPAPKQLTAAERFMAAARVDQPPAMPPWRDPRPPATPADRWRR